MKTNICICFLVLLFVNSVNAVSQEIAISPVYKTNIRTLEISVKNSSLNNMTIMNNNHVINHFSHIYYEIKDSSGKILYTSGDEIMGYSANGDFYPYYVVSLNSTELFYVRVVAQGTNLSNARRIYFRIHVSYYLPENKKFKEIVVEKEFPYSH